YMELVVARDHEQAGDHATALAIARAALAAAERRAATIPENADWQLLVGQAQAGCAIPLAHTPGGAAEARRLATVALERLQEFKQKGLLGDPEDEAPFVECQQLLR